MQIIAGPRGSGKTTELIRFCEKTPGSIIVCATRREAESINERAKIIGANIAKPIRFGALVNGHLDTRQYPNLLFDNLESMIRMFMIDEEFDECNVIAATISDENMRFVSHGTDVAM